MKTATIVAATLLLGGVLQAGPVTVLHREGRAQVGALDFSPDGRTLAVGTSGAPPEPHRLPQARIEIWDLESGTRTSSFRRSAWTPDGDSALSTVAVGFAPDGRGLLGTDELAVSVFDMESGASRFVVPSWATSPYGRCGWSSDGRHIVAPRNDLETQSWETTVYDAIHGQALTHLPAKANAACFSPDGRLVAAVGHGCHVFEVSSGRELFADTSEPGLFFAVAFSPDGCHLVAAPGWGGALDLYDVSVVGGVCSITAAGSSALTGEKIVRIQFTPDGKRALTTSTTGTRLWDAKGWKDSVRWAGVTGCLSRDGSRIAASGADGLSAADVEIWNLDAAPWAPAPGLSKR